MTPFIKACIQANEEVALTIKEYFDPSWFEKTVVGAGGDISSKLDVDRQMLYATISYGISFSGSCHDRLTIPLSLSGVNEIVRFLGDDNQL